MKLISEIQFSGPIWQWRGPAPFYFVTVPPQESNEIKQLSKLVTYGWGMIPVSVQIGKTEWKTSLFAKDGSYVVPIKLSVRTAEKLSEGDSVDVSLNIR